MYSFQCLRSAKSSGVNFQRLVESASRAWSRAFCSFRRSRRRPCLYVGSTGSSGSRIDANKNSGDLMMADSTRHVVCPHCSAINRTPPDRPARQAKCGTCHQKLFSGKPASADAETFERHITRNDIPVMVDFWAPWCGPCLAMAPAYERAAAELEPDFRLLKVNTEEEPALAARYGIRAYRPSYCSCTVARSHGVPGRAMRAGSFPGQRRRVSTGGPRPVRIDGRSRRANPDRPLVHTTKRFTSTDELYSAAMRSQVISRCSSLSPARRGGGMRTMRSPSKRTPRT